MGGGCFESGSVLWLGRFFGSCGTEPPASPARAGGGSVVRRVTPLHEPAACFGRLVRHVFPHTTRANYPRQPFDSNGAGAIDIALAGLGAPMTVLWNRGSGLRRVLLRAIYTNTLQVRGADGGFENRAAGAGVDATGWSWSAQFGDLDNDGDLDLYTVNGMVGEAFGHLPSAELVEENQALRNDGAGVFAPAPQWGIGATESGRGMALADLDLDIVVNNSATPAMLLENQVCGGTSLEVDLRWPGSANPFAAGSKLALTTERNDLLAPDAGRQRLPVRRPAARTLRLAARRTPADAVGGVV